MENFIQNFLYITNIRVCNLSNKFKNYPTLNSYHHERYYASILILFISAKNAERDNKTQLSFITFDLRKY